ncbi:hypothetical protein BH24ACT18_BH24ACT18_00130 [soil metagenome]|nr:hypothetical protein [Actinomycetota bacterium]
MNFVLTVIGVVLLLICLAGVASGVYIAAEHKNRESGVLFALCWVSGAAGAAGVAMRDGVTFLVGMVCFLVAGAVFLLFGDVKGGSGRRERGKSSGRVPEGSEKTTKENRSGHRRAAS